MSMLKNLKSIFVIEEEAEKASPKKSNNKPKRKLSEPKKVPQTPQPTRSSSGSQNAERPGKITPKFSEILLNALEKANQPGFDYLEFKKALQNLKKLNMDDATRFQSAYAAAQSMGITPQKLIQSADHYLKVLSKEEHNFNEALKAQQQRQVRDQQAELPKLDQEVKQLEAEIKALQERIKKAKTKQQQISKNIGDAEVKLRNTHNDFEASYNAIAEQIRKDVEGMKAYLG